jgi:hypothetical protein
MGKVRSQIQQENNSNKSTFAKKSTEIEAAQLPQLQENLLRSHLAGNIASSDLPLTPQNMMYLQRTVGNQAVGRFIQAKLKIGQPNDKYEQEADRVADQVMSMPDPKIQRAPT